VQGGSVTGQGTWNSTFEAGCPVPPQSDALTVTGQVNGTQLLLTFTNAGPTDFHLGTCAGVLTPNVTLKRFLSGDTLTISVDAHDGATGTATTFPGMMANIISFQAQVTLKAGQ
jgi:hypothetical protein